MQCISKLGSPLAIYLFKSTLFQWPRCGSIHIKEGDLNLKRGDSQLSWNLSSCLAFCYQSFVQFLMFRQCCVFESSFWSELSVNGDFPRPAKPPDRKKQVQRLKGGFCQFKAGFASAYIYDPVSKIFSPDLDFSGCYISWSSVHWAVGMAVRCRIRKLFVSIPRLTLNSPTFGHSPIFLLHFFQA